MSGRTIRPLVTGGAGQVGSILAEVLYERYPSTVGATRVELDITDAERLASELERLEPSVVINCAAMTDVDGCERDPYLAFRINRDGAANVARAARRIGARILQVSTDFVFDGTARRPYREEDPPQPLSVYGRSKWEGEQAVARETPDHLILRTSWVYGGKNARFVAALLSRAREGVPLRVVADQVGGPTHRWDLAQAICRLLSIPARGILHFANLGQCTRHEFAEAILEASGLDVPVEPIPTKPGPGSARRPAYSVLDTSRYRELTGQKIRHWREALREHFRAEGIR